MFDGYSGNSFIVKTQISNVYDLLCKDTEFKAEKLENKKNIKINTLFEESSEELYYYLHELLNTNNIIVNTIIS